MIISALKGQLLSTPWHRHGSSHQQRPERAAQPITHDIVVGQ